MYPNFDGLAGLFLFLAVLAVFGAWKLVEILLWVFSHLHWSAL